MDQETPASPFLPGTQIQYALDSTSLGWLKTCPRLYYYHMIEGWTSDTESVHLRFGIEYHSALQDYDKSRAVGIPHDDAVHDVVRALLERTADWRPDHKYKNRDNLLRTVIWYLDKFKDDPAQTVILANGKPAVELSFKFELDWGPKSQPIAADGVVSAVPGGITNVNPQLPYILCGHLDRVVTFQDELYVMDRKTTVSTPGDYYFDQFNPNNQMTLYTLASQVILNAPVKGIIIDSAQVTIEFSRFTRGMTYRTQDHIQEWLNDLKVHLLQAELYALDNYWPMNDTACNNYGGCKFRAICQKSPQVRDAFLNSKFKKGPKWNPLIER